MRSSLMYLIYSSLLLIDEPSDRSAIYLLSESYWIYTSLEA